MRNKRIYLIVTRDGQDCGIASAKELGLGADLCRVRGLLVVKQPVKVFSRESECLRLIQRSHDAICQLRGTLVDQTPRLQPLLQGGTYFVRRVNKRAGKLVPYQDAALRVPKIPRGWKVLAIGDLVSIGDKIWSGAYFHLLDKDRIDVVGRVQVGEVIISRDA